MVKLRLPRKIVLIGSGVVILCGATGATAFFIGRDAILGPSEQELSGIACTDVVRYADLRKGRGPWLRKYVRVAAGTDGLTRAKTAIRVATEVQKTLPADLIEIVILDEKGPDKRAFMRGRAVGAEVILVKDPAGLPGVTGKFTVNYYEGAASDTGMFYGKAESMSSAEAEKLASKMDKLSDCAPPPDKVDAGAEKDKKKKPAHGGSDKEAPKHGEAAAKPGEHGAADPAAAAGEHGAAPTEAANPSFMSKMMGMVGLGGGKEEAPAPAEHGAAPAAGGHEAAVPSGGHGGDAAPSEGHGDAGAASHEAAPAHGEAAAAASGPDGHSAAPASGGHEAAAPADGHGAAAQTGNHNAEAAVSPEAAPPHGEAAPAPSAGDAAPSEAPKKSLVSKMLGIVGLGGSDKPATLIEHSGGPAIASGTPKVVEGGAAKAAAGHEASPAAAHEAAPEKPPEKAPHETDNTQH